MKFPHDILNALHVRPAMLRLQRMNMHFLIYWVLKTQYCFNTLKYKLWQNNAFSSCLLNFSYIQHAKCYLLNGSGYQIMDPGNRSRSGSRSPGSLALLVSFVYFLYKIITHLNVMPLLFANF